MGKLTKLKPKPRKPSLPFGKLGRKGRRAKLRDGFRVSSKGRTPSIAKVVMIPEPVSSDADATRIITAAPTRSILKKPFSFTESIGALEQGRSGWKTVKFCPTVEVHEFSLRAGGSDCVPQDGSNLAIGLGELLRTTSHPLCPKPRNCGEGVTFLTLPARRRLLVASGGPNISKTWGAHRAELDEVQRSRAIENMDAVNFQPMVSSLRKAQARAMKLATMLQKGRETNSPQKESTSPDSRKSFYNSCLKRPAACAAENSSASTRKTPHLEEVDVSVASSKKDEKRIRRKGFAYPQGLAKLHRKRKTQPTASKK